MNLNETVIKYYRYGWNLNDIAEELQISEDEVKQELLTYKNTKGRGARKSFTDEFKLFVYDRLHYGDKVETYDDVSATLEISNATLSKINKEYKGTYGETSVDEDSEENMYEPIDWDVWDECPTCHSTKVNLINDTADDENLNTCSSYCMDCGTEWLKRNGQTCKINWEYLDRVAELEI